MNDQKIIDGGRLALTEFTCPKCGGPVTNIRLEQKVPATWEITGIKNGKLCVPHSFETHDPEDADKLEFVCQTGSPAGGVECGHRWSAERMDELGLIDFDAALAKS
jgi:hypothetical protein